MGGGAGQLSGGALGRSDAEEVEEESTWDEEYFQGGREMVAGPRGLARGRSGGHFEGGAPWSMQHFVR